MNFITKKSISRRRFLHGASASIALPLLDAMIPALAKSPAAVQRFAFIYVPNGINMNEWMPDSTGEISQFKFTLEPLDSYRSYVNVVSGLYADGLNDHPPTPALWLSGSYPAVGDRLRLATTVDQVIAQAIGQDTAFPSLELAIEDQSNLLGACAPVGPSCSYMNTISWRTPTQPMPMEINPRILFERMFGGDATTPEARAARVRKHASILDTVLVDIAELNRGLNAADHAKLDQYLDGVREVERQIVMGERSRKDKNVKTPEFPIGIPESFEDHVRLMLKLQALAFQADLTRVTSFMMAREFSAITYPHLGVPDAHHPVSHHGYSDDGMMKKAKIDRFHVSLFAEYLNQLHSIQEGYGSILDHSVILYGTSMSDSNVHDHLNLPNLIIGGGAGQLTGGRHIQNGVLADEQIKAVPEFKDLKPQANLMVSLMNLAGIERDSFGDNANASTGAVAL